MRSIRLLSALDILEKFSFKFFSIILLLFFTTNIKAQYPYTESFETGFGIWTQLTGDQFDWSLQTGAGPAYPITGPSSAYHGNNYIFINSGLNNPSKVAAIEADFDFSSLASPILIFNYHMFTSIPFMGSLYVDVYDGSQWSMAVWGKTDNQGNAWQQAEICLANFGLGNKPNAKIRFRAISGNQNSDIAIDNITINGLSVTKPISTVDILPCYSDCTGAINSLAATGGISPYTFSIDGGSSFHSSASFSGLCASDYIIKVKDANGCLADGGTVRLYQPQQLAINTVEVLDIANCPGDQTGAIKVFASGGTGTYTYSLNGGPFQTSNIFSNLGGGTYTISVKDATNICTATRTNVIIHQPAPITFVSVTKTDVANCYGDLSGTITISADGGNSPLTYSITGKPYQDGFYFFNLAGGDYTISIVDSKGCSATYNQTIHIDQPPEIIITKKDHTDISTCHGGSDGTITLDATGGTGGLWYSITGGLPFVDQKEFTNLTAGNYQVLVVDAKACIKNGGVVSVLQPQELTIVSEIAYDDTTCFNGNKGKIVINAIGGTAPLYYSIDQNISWTTSAVHENLPAGAYKVFVKDSHDCSKEGSSFIISQPTEVIITNVVSYDVTSCYGGDNGSVTISAQGGSHELYYSIDDGATFKQADNFFDHVKAGSYRIWVKDRHDCTAKWPLIYITEPSDITINSVDTKNVPCFGGFDGSITVTASGGTGQLQYSVNAGISYSILNEINGLPIGSYSIMVRDANGCTKAGNTYTLSEPTKIVITSEDYQDINTCYNDNIGWIQVTATGGIAPLQYSIDGGISFKSNNLFSNLPASPDYLVVVKDANDCQIEGSRIIINQPSNFYITNQTKEDVKTCQGGNNGSITITATGGTTPYMYSIDDGVTYQPENVFLNLYAGSYRVKVADAHNCTSQGSLLALSEPSKINIAGYSHADISCFGKQDGTITIIASGGQAPLRYSIDDGNSYYQNYFFDNLRNGIYSLRVTDMYDCTVAVGNVIIEPATEIKFTNLSYTNISTCFGDKNGSITIQASGGKAPLEYSISNGNYYNNTGLYTNLGAGSNKILVKDANGCFLAGPSITISEPLPISIRTEFKTDVSCSGSTDGTITLEANGGTGKLFYSIDNGVIFSNSTFYTNLSKGSYPVVIKDENGCTKTGSNLNIIEPNPLSIVALYKSDLTCYSYQNGEISITVIGGNGGYQYSIDNMNYQSNSVFSNLNEGTYVISVKDFKGCSIQSSPVTLIRPVSSASFTLDALEGCSPFTVRIMNSQGNIYLWDFGDGTIESSHQEFHTYIIPNNSLDVSYTITAVAISEIGCHDTVRQTVRVKSQPIINFSALPQKVYYPNSTVYLQNLSQTGTINYMWDFGDNTSSSNPNVGSHNYMNCGDYTIRLTASNTDNCYDTCYQTIRVEPQPPFAVFSTDVNEGCSPLAVNFSNNSSSALSFLWDFGDGGTSTQTNPAYIFTKAGKFTVSLTAFGECGSQITTKKVINVIQTPIADFEAKPDTVMLPSQFVRFVNLSKNAEKFTWFFGDDSVSVEANPIHLYAKPGEYTIKLIAKTKEGCIDSIKSLKPTIVLPAAEIIFPTAFTPNGDGLNDFFLPVMHGIRKYELTVYNKKGHPIFYTEDKTEGWNGKCGSKTCPMDNYIWRVTGTKFTGELFELKGVVLLIP